MMTGKPTLSAIFRISAGSLSFVGTADDVAARLREQAGRWDLDEILVVTYAHDPALRRRSYELLAQAWRA